MDTYNSVSSGWWEECVFVFNKKEVCLVLVKGVCEIVTLWADDVIGQAERTREPLQRDILTMRDVTLPEGNFYLQHIRISGQNIPRSVNLQEICLLVFGVLMKKQLLNKNLMQSFFRCSFLFYLKKCDVICKQFCFLN